MDEPLSNTSPGNTSSSKVSRITSGTRSALRAAQQQGVAYAHGEERPLGGYLGAMGIFTGAVAGAVGLAKLTGRRPPEQVGAWDTVLLTVATARISRTLAKDSVTSPLRAPFTRYVGRSGESELAEEVRGRGATHTVGELITCPFCLGQWVGAALAGGLVFAPRFTRLAAAASTALFGADVLQFAYAKVQEWGTS